jgi:hypothetical protein
VNASLLEGGEMGVAVSHSLHVFIDALKVLAPFSSGESCHNLSRMFARRVGRASGALNIENSPQCVINYFHNNVHLTYSMHREYLVYIAAALFNYLII